MNSVSSLDNWPRIPNILLPLKRSLNCGHNTRWHDALISSYGIHGVSDVRGRFMNFLGPNLQIKDFSQGTNTSEHEIAFFFKESLLLGGCVVFHLVMS